MRVTGPISLMCMVLWSTSLRAEQIQLLGREFLPQDFPVAAGQKALVSGDVNGDGHTDLIVVSRGNNQLTVYLGDGNGQFKQLEELPAGPAPSHVTIADINSDQHADLVIANHETSNVTLLLGEGNGAFKPAPNSPLNTGADPHVHVAHTADIDADGIKDLVVDSRDDRGLVLLKGVVNGEFVIPGKVIDMGGDPYLGFAIGDINGDNLPDLVSPNEASIGIALSDGAGDASFRAGPIAQLDSPFALSLADINGDGHTDVAVATNDSRPSARLLMGDGQGSLKDDGQPIPIPRGAKSLATGDITGDGVADVVVAGWSTPEIVIISQHDNMGFRRVVLDDIDNPWGLTIADLDGDGIGDLIIADGIRPYARIYMNRPESD